MDWGRWRLRGAGCVDTLVQKLATGHARLGRARDPAKPVPVTAWNWENVREKLAKFAASSASKAMKYTAGLSAIYSLISRVFPTRWRLAMS